MNRIEIAVIGPSFVGKSTICNALANRKVNLAEEYIPTIGVDLGVHYLKPKHNFQSSFKIYFWDTAGSKRFMSLLTSYIKKASVVILCFAINDLGTFEKMMDMYYFFHSVLQNKKIILISTKHDVPEFKHQIPPQLEEFIQETGVKYIKTSSKDKTGIKEIINVCENYYDDLYTDKKTVTPVEIKEEKKGFCKIC